VGVCDREPLMAKQLSERFSVKGHYSSLSEMLAASYPDVIHITTPPASHFSIAKACIEFGCHVYVEKPFALCEADARVLINLAVSRGRKITVGHDDQFSHVARRMRALVHEGYLGGSPVHMESYYCYEIGKSVYSGALLSDRTHWVRQLPGKLLHNIISHGIARIAEFLTTDSPEVIAYGFTSPFLRSLGESEIIDELRVIIHSAGGSTAYFTFSSQMRPGLHGFRVFGPKNGLLLDQDQETLIKLPGTRYKSYAEKFVPPMAAAGQYLRNVRVNLQTFLGNDFQMKAGMKFLIESFYRCILDRKPDPIPYREILLTARVMDTIFCQLERQRLDTPTESKLAVPIGVRN
jgi:predicted dehydrogenase